MHDDDIFPFFREFNVFSIENLKFISNLGRSDMRRNHFFLPSGVDAGKYKRTWTFKNNTAF